MTQLHCTEAARFVYHLPADIAEDLSDIWVLLDDALQAIGFFVSAPTRPPPPSQIIIIIIIINDSSL